MIEKKIQNIITPTQSYMKLFRAISIVTNEQMNEHIYIHIGIQMIVFV